MKSPAASTVTRVQRRSKRRCALVPHGQIHAVSSGPQQMIDTLQACVASCAADIRTGNTATGA